MGMDLERTHGQSTVRFRYGGITVVSHKGVVFNCAKRWQINCVVKSTQPHFSILVCQLVLANSNDLYCSTRSVSINYQYQNGGPPFLRVFEINCISLFFQLSTQQTKQQERLGESSKSYNFLKGCPIFLIFGVYAYFKVLFH